MKNRKGRLLFFPHYENVKAGRNLCYFDYLKKKNNHFFILKESEFLNIFLDNLY